MKIAIIGATSQIAKDFIRQCNDEHALLLFSRKTKQVEQFMSDLNYKNFVALDYGVLKGRQFYVDAVINFVGVGDPARLAQMKGEIFELTKKYDDISLQFMRRPNTKYIFLSSGAAYGGTFDKPARYGEKITYPQEITPQHYYGLAKWMAEVKHRVMFDKHIVDLRVFSYFSHTQPLNLKFMIMEMMQAILRQRGIDTTPYAVDDTDIMRDYIGPEDLHQLIFSVLNAPGFNGAIDAYTREPVSKHALLVLLKEFYGLSYVVTERIFSAPTGIKPNYYSEYYKASTLGYQPRMSSLETILKEADKLLERHDPGSKS